MTQRFFEITNKKIKVYDAETSTNELLFEFLINFTYAFVQNIITVFIVNKTDIGVLFAMGGYYYFLSYILTRNKYNSKFGRYIFLPIGMILGGFTAYKLGYILMNLF